MVLIFQVAAMLLLLMSGRVLAQADTQRLEERLSQTAGRELDDKPILAEVLSGLGRAHSVSMSGSAVRSSIARLARPSPRCRPASRPKLRTPLYGMTGLAESLLDGIRGELPAGARPDLSMLVASGRRLGALVGDILDFSKLRHRSIELDLRPVDLRSMTEIALTLTRPLAGAKRLDLRNAVGADLPAAWADENRLQQILLNLLGNAVKLTESGKVEVSAVASEDQLRVSVADTGPGIPEEQQARIFEAFQQADGSIERAYGGTGLGLAVSRQLVELHGGTLGLESTPGEGSTFFFTLPKARKEVAAAPSTAPPLQADETAAGAPPTEIAVPERAMREDSASILVVDDEPVTGGMARWAFRAGLLPAGQRPGYRAPLPREDLRSLRAA